MSGAADVPGAVSAWEEEQHAGWRLRFAPEPLGASLSLRRELISAATAVADSLAGTPVRRSRHGATYRIALSGDTVVFVKLFDPVRNMGRLKRWFRRSRAENAAQIAGKLAAAGFGVARPLMVGCEEHGGRTMVATDRVVGEPLVRVLAHLGGGSWPQRRVVLRDLGWEVGRLHRMGFVHGDLTPYNVFVTGGARMGFVFIDHERTRRAFFVGRGRRQMRNLVQLGRFLLPTLTTRDYARFLRSYAAALGSRRTGRKRLARRVVSMLKRRIAADKLGLRSPTPPPKR